MFLFSPLITILEDRGVEQTAFLELQNEALARIHVSTDTLLKTAEMLKKHQLGSRYGLAHILNCLSSIGMRTRKEKRFTDCPFDDFFWDRLFLVAKNSLLRDIKHGARIPVPESYHLVGVADEGPTYKEGGGEDIFTLKEGEIYCT